MLARGQSANYRFDGYDNSVGAWIWIEVGSSDGLDVSGQEPYDVVLEYSESSDTLRDSGGTTEFFTLGLGDEELPTVAIDEAGFGICTLAQQASDGETTMVGYAHLEGGYAKARLEYGGAALRLERTQSRFDCEAFRQSGRVRWYTVTGVHSGDVDPQAPRPLVLLVFPLLH